MRKGKIMMKKLMQLSSAALLLAVSAVCAAESSGNLIRNPQFLETKNKNPDIPDGRLPDPWNVYGGLKALPEGCGVSKTEKPEGYGGNSYVIAGNCLVRQSTLAVTPGKTYRVSCPGAALRRTGPGKWAGPDAGRAP